MPSTKRKALDTNLQRRVRARRESSEDIESVASVLPSNKSGSPASEDEDISDSGESEEQSEASAPEEAASISFGALAKAQATMTRPGAITKRPKNKQDGDAWEDNEALERKAGRKDHRDFNRSSKHAPTEISSKKAVSRKREVVPVAKREFRDPRFEPLSGYVDEANVKAAYSFLDGYREDEMKELKLAIKNTKDEDAKEKLKRALMSMESKKKAQMRKQKEQEILDTHRKAEKELVKQGKQPFYLKKAEQKKRMLLDQFGELKGKKLDHVIERRRKKQGRDKKKMPFKRRDVESELS